MTISTARYAELAEVTKIDEANYRIIKKAKKAGFGVGFGFDPMGDGAWLGLTALDAREYLVNLGR